MTPSPVIATTWPFLLQRLDEAHLVPRARRGRRRRCPRPARRAPRRSARRSRCPRAQCLRCRAGPAIAPAVVTWSPVLGQTIDLLPIINEFKEHGIRTDRIIVGGDSDFLAAKRRWRKSLTFAANMRSISTYVPQLVGLNTLRAPVAQDQSAQEKIQSDSLFTIVLFPVETPCGFFTEFAADRRLAARYF